jgi:hypothetical protein
MQARATPVALPAPEPQQQTPAKPGVPAPRPMAGPVIPLTGANTAPEDLAGSGPQRAAPPDPTAARVLVRGEPPAAPSGRADDFSWPRAAADDASVIPAAVLPTPTPAPQRPTKKGPAKGPAPAADKDKAGPKRGGQAAEKTTPAPTRQVR